jgi:hypothetical protein
LDVPYRYYEFLKFKIYEPLNCTLDLSRDPLMLSSKAINTLTNGSEPWIWFQYILHAWFSCHLLSANECSYNCRCYHFILEQNKNKFFAHNLWQWKVHNEQSKITTSCSYTLQCNMWGKKDIAFYYRHVCTTYKMANNILKTSKKI